MKNPLDWIAQKVYKPVSAPERSLPPDSLTGPTLEFATVNERLQCLFIIVEARLRKDYLNTRCAPEMHPVWVADIFKNMKANYPSVVKQEDSEAWTSVIGSTLDAFLVLEKF